MSLVLVISRVFPPWQPFPRLSRFMGKLWTTVFPGCPINRDNLGKGCEHKVFPSWLSFSREGKRLPIFASWPGQPGKRLSQSRLSRSHYIRPGQPAWKRGSWRRVWHTEVIWQEKGTELKLPLCHSIKKLQSARRAACTFPGLLPSTCVSSSFVVHCCFRHALGLLLSSCLPLSATPNFRD